MMQKSGFITIVGRPNSGKSTLLNAILQTQISIVTPKAQTTREQIQGILTEKEGQIIFIDTPGIHKAREGGLNEFMVNQAKEALETPHLIWYLVDPHSSMEHENPVIEILENAPHVPVILLMNKVDTIRSESYQAQLSQFQKALEETLQKKNLKWVKTEQISALKNAGLKKLLNDSWNYIPEGPFYYPDPDQVSNRPMKFFVAEKVREQLFHCLGDEVPYSCAVEITQFNENSKPIRIEAIIHVERESQKGIVIGQGGKKIKEIGQAARSEIEKFLEQKIFLGLKVELAKNWTQNQKDLKKMGYSS